MRNSVSVMAGTCTDQAGTVSLPFGHLRNLSRWRDNSTRPACLSGRPFLGQLHQKSYFWREKDFEKLACILKSLKKPFLPSVNAERSQYNGIMGALWQLHPCNDRQDVFSASQLEWEKERTTRCLIGALFEQAEGGDPGWQVMPSLSSDRG